MKHSKNTQQTTRRSIKRFVALILSAVSCLSLATMPQLSASFRDYSITASASSDKFNSDTIVLTTGSTLAYNTTKYSQNKRFRLNLDNCGNLSIYDTIENRITWQTNTGIDHNYATHSFFLKMQEDGNLVIYQTQRHAKTPTAIWNTKTVTGVKSNGYSLRLSNDGELYVYFADRNQSLFSSRSEISCTAKSNAFLRASQCLSSPNCNYRAIMQSDGNFVVYRKESGKEVAVWNSQTARNNGAFLALQQDGNLVVYSSASKPLWNTVTSAAPFTDYKLSLDNNGVLTLTRKYDNKARWTSTSGKIKTSAAADAQYRVKNHFEYSSIDDAAKDFIVAYNGMSVSQNREYGSTINKIGENRYVFRHICWGAVRNGPSGDCGDHWCIWNDTVAYVHTHGVNWVTANRYFSKGDMDLVNNDTCYQYAYLGNASGEVYRYKKGDPCSDYTKTGRVSGTKIDSNIGKYIDKTSTDTTITSRQNSGSGIYAIPQSQN